MTNNNQNEDWKVLVFLLKEIAKQKQITHVRIAEATKMKPNNVSRFFNADIPPNIKTFVKIAKAIGVNFFFEDRESKTDLNLAMEKAMELIGRRINKTPKN